VQTQKKTQKFHIKGPIQHTSKTEAFTAVTIVEADTEKTHIK